jgi:hypothetical protein
VAALRGVALGTLACTVILIVDPRTGRDGPLLLVVAVMFMGLVSAPLSLIELRPRRDWGALAAGWGLSFAATAMAYAQGFYAGKLAQAGSFDGALAAIQDDLERGVGPLIVVAAASAGAVLATLFLLVTVLRLGLVSQRARDGFVFFTFPVTWLVLQAYALVDRFGPPPPSDEPSS